MKIYPGLIALALIITTASLRAQDLPALKLQNGTYLIASTKATPLVHPVLLSELLDAYQLNIIDEKTLRLVEGSSVMSFTMTVITSRGNKTISAKGNEISTEMKQQLQSLNAGDKIYFEYIIGMATDSTTTKMNAMAFKVL